MKNKGFTIFESTVVLLVSAIVLGAVFGLTSLNKNFYEFQKTKLLLAENLRLAQDLSFKKIEVNINNSTSTVCGIGILISKSNYLGIVYATSGENVDCYKIASDTPGEFNFTNKSPNLYFAKNAQIITDRNNPLIVFEELKDYEIRYSTGNAPNSFNSTSIMFLHPYGDPLIYVDNNKIDFANKFNLILTKNQDNATISITNAGQIISE